MDSTEFNASDHILYVFASYGFLSLVNDIVVFFKAEYRKTLKSRYRDSRYTALSESESSEASEVPEPKSSEVSESSDTEEDALSKLEFIESESEFEHIVTKRKRI